MVRCACVVHCRENVADQREHTSVLTNYICGVGGKGMYGVCMYVERVCYML